MDEKKDRLSLGVALRECHTAEIERLRQMFVEMHRLLNELEWSGWSNSASGPDCCPLCRHAAHDGKHSRDCRLGNLLARLRSSTG